MCGETWRVVVFLDMCVILCAVLITGADQLRKVEAHLGHSVNMQCVVPVPNITQWRTLRLYLQKPMPSSSPQVVFSFSDGQEQPDHQDSAYKNRCRLFKDNLTLSLSNIQPSDQGRYDCKIFLLKSQGHKLEYTGQLLLSTWAEYSRPQIALVAGSSGVARTAVCSSDGGYPRGDVEWTINPDNPGLRNSTQTWADCDPQTRLYNVSAQLSLPSPTGGSIYCCVVAADRRVCSDTTEVSGAGSQETSRSLILLCLILMTSLTLYLLQPAGIHVHGGGDGQ
ncbi:ICOS ligand-like [Dendropsophus ebraccatus]|uniref:ICOS ligand-like n=1 Tax=Dendropsophus ebraccatus TaxID=150705 RepID=UPI003831EC40